MSLEGADEEQIQVVSVLKDTGKAKLPVGKRSFLKNAGLFLRAREKILNNFKSKIFPTKNPEKILAPKPAPDTLKPTKDQNKKSPFKLNTNFFIYNFKWWKKYK